MAKGASIDAHWRALFEANVPRIQGGANVPRIQGGLLPDSKLVCDAFRKARGDRLDDGKALREFLQGVARMNSDADT